MEVMQSIGALLDTGFGELRLQEVEKRSCMVDCGLGVLPQPPAVDVIARGETFNLDSYIKTLQKLKQHYWRVWSNRILGDMLIHHDNTRPHTSL
jgi:arginine/lysine/ornithine decarboxylase